MTRLARIVIPGTPHHVTQRGNRREPVFFEDGDHLRYLALLAESAKTSGTEVWAYCLMPNHVHLIAVPQHADGLRALFADSHRRYTRYINWRQGWTGHLWQGRFGSVAMDEGHLAAAVAYVLNNPVRAGLAKRAEDWKFSSARTHLYGDPDPLVNPAPLSERFGDFRTLLERTDDRSFVALRRSETTGRPLGAGEWLGGIAAATGRVILPGKRGPKPK